MSGCGRWPLLDGILTIDRAESTKHIIKASELDDVLDAMDEPEEQ